MCDMDLPGLFPEGKCIVLYWALCYDYSFSLHISSKWVCSLLLSSPLLVAAYGSMHCLGLGFIILSSLMVRYCYVNVVGGLGLSPLVWHIIYALIMRTPSS